MKIHIWYITRLSRMTFPEILYRINHKCSQYTDKVKYPKSDSEVKIFPKVDLLKIYALSGHLTHGNINEELITQADDALKNRFEIFGIKVSFEGKIDWHQDPKTKKNWPKKFWGDVNIRDGSSIGGAKFVWELNRLYCLPVLGLAYRKTGKKKYAGKIFSILREWAEENPYPVGVNWTNGIELGVRVANLIQTLSYLEGFEFTDDDYDVLNNFVYHHGRHLYRYPSKYSSINNHTLAEAFGLFLAGLYFTNLPDSEKWFKYGKTVLEREVKNQILPDGGSYEYTTTYLSFILDFYLLFKLFCDRNSIVYDTAVDKKLLMGCRFIRAIMDSNGNIPNIGDQDSAVLINFAISNWDNFKSILNTCSVMFNKPELKQNNFPDDKTGLILGDMQVTSAKSAGADVMGQTDEDCDRGLRTSFLPESGLAVIDDWVENKNIHFVGNAMPLGLPPLSGHGHLDALSFILTVDGKEIFIDPGTYLYHSGGKWRKYFRSTAAHNTVRVDGTDFSEQVADFMYGKSYQIHEHSIKEVGDKILWKAGHNAYMRLKSPVMHFREVGYMKGKGIFEISDLLESKGKYFTEQFYHLHPECKVGLSDNEVRINRNGLCVILKIDERLNVECYKGSKNPLLGWFSHDFNHIEETNTIVCSGNMDGNVNLKTYVYPQFNKNYKR